MKSLFDLRNRRPLGLDSFGLKQKSESEIKRSEIRIETLCIYKKKYIFRLGSYYIPDIPSFRRVRSSDLNIRRVVTRELVPPWTLRRATVEGSWRWTKVLVKCMSLRLRDYHLYVKRREKELARTNQIIKIIKRSSVQNRNT